MTDRVDQDSAAQAFDALRGQVALLQRALEGLVAEQKAAPDYRPTIESLVQRQDNVAVVLKGVLAAPALQLTPERLAAEIAQAAEASRGEDRKLVAEAVTRMSAAAQQIERSLALARDAKLQETLLKRFTAGGVLVGAVAWAILPGVFGRALPTSWHVPERVAARALRATVMEGGRRMIDAAGRLSGSPAEVRPALKEASPPAPAAPIGCAKTRTPTMDCLPPRAGHGHSRRAAGGHPLSATRRSSNRDLPLPPD